MSDLYSGKIDAYDNEEYDVERDLTDEMLEEEAEDYYEDAENSPENDDYYEDEDNDYDEPRQNHFECQRAGTCCLGCEDCDLENECSMCTHDGNNHYCDTCIVAEY